MNKKLILFYALLAAAFSSYVFSSDWELVWQDEFNGSISSDWRFDAGYGSWGWGNDEWQFYTQDNAIVTDSTLIIRAALEGRMGKRNGSIRSAKLTTQNKFSFQYGKIEARIKLPAGKGLWPAFWMLGTNITEVSWPRCGEIDIMENVNGERIIHGTAHWGENGDRKSYGNSVQNVEITEFNVYSIIWDQNYIRWQLNGVEYSSLDITSENFSAFHKNFYVILNLAVGGNWPGDPDSTTPFPAEMEIDYVRVYKMDGPRISAYPPEMRFLMDRGGSRSTEPQILNIANLGTDILDAVIAQTDADWLDMAWINNTGNSQSLEVRINENADTLLFGSQTAILVLTASNASPDTAHVHLQVGTNLVLNNIVSASSVEPNPPNNENVRAGNVNDGNRSTRWLSEAADPQWISIHLNRLFFNRIFSVEAVKLYWDETYAEEYEIHLSSSSDFSEYTIIAAETEGDGGLDYVITDSDATGKFIRLYGISRSGEGGYSLQEFEVYARGASTSVEEYDAVENSAESTLQTAPNPFNMETNVYFSISKKQRVDIDLYNINGQLVKNILSEVKLPGSYHVPLNGNNLSSGVYFLQLRSLTNKITNKIILQK